MPETPFDSVESAQTYIALLRDAVAEAQDGVRQDIAAAAAADRARHLDALRLVDLKLTQLGVQLGMSSRVLNDLRMLRRLLVGEEADEQ
jgi:hypothetical protein